MQQNFLSSRYNPTNHFQYLGSEIPSKRSMSVIVRKPELAEEVEQIVGD
jgi:hypothetical protein